MLATIAPAMLAKLRRNGEKLALVDVRTPTAGLEDVISVDGGTSACEAVGVPVV